MCIMGYFGHTGLVSQNIPIFHIAGGGINCVMIGDYSFYGADVCGGCGFDTGINHLYPQINSSVAISHKKKKSH